MDLREAGRITGIMMPRLSAIGWACTLLLVLAGYLTTPAGQPFYTSSEMGMMLTIKDAPVLAISTVGLVVAPRGVPVVNNVLPGVAVVVSASLLW